MPTNNNTKFYDTLIHIGCGANPNLGEYRTLAKHVWFVDADPQAIAELQEISQRCEGVNILHALIDSEKRSGTFYRYSLPWINSIAPVDEFTLRLYPGLKSLDSAQQLTTPIDELLTNCLEEEQSHNNILLLDLGHQNENLLQTMEEKGVMGLLQLVLVLPAHRRVQPVSVPPSLHIQATAPTSLTLPEGTQVLTHHSFFQDFQRQKALASECQRALEQSQNQLIERDQQLAECTQQRDEKAQQVKSVAKENEELKLQRNDLSNLLEEARKKTKDALHQNHLNWEAKNAAEARLEQLRSACNEQVQKDINVSHAEDGFYRAFEDKFRGSREEIKRRVSVYLPFVQPVAKRHAEFQALDLGCGRGEWLEVLKEAGIEGEGVDQDAGMLEGAKAQGLSVYYGDALSYLSKQPDASRICISLMHVVEHIPFEMLRTIVAEAKRVLVPDGLLIMETPNPENYTVGSCSFHLDPTHRNPLPPALLAFVPEYYGFARTKLLRLQENEEIKEKAIFEIEDFLTEISPDYAILAQAGIPSGLEANSDESSAWKKEYGISLSLMVQRNSTQKLVSE